MRTNKEESTRQNTELTDLLQLSSELTTFRNSDGQPFALLPGDDINQCDVVPVRGPDFRSYLYERFHELHDRFPNEGNLRLARDLIDSRCARRTWSGPPVSPATPGLPRRARPRPRPPVPRRRRSGPRNRHRRLGRQQLQRLPFPPPPRLPPLSPSRARRTRGPRCTSSIAWRSRAHVKKAYSQMQARLSGVIHYTRSFRLVANRAKLLR